MLAHPSFDDRSNFLHRAFDIDEAFGVARQLERACQLDAKAVFWKPDHPRPMHRTIVLTRETRDRDVRPAGTSEEIDSCAGLSVLVDKHSEMTASVEHGTHEHAGR